MCRKLTRMFVGASPDLGALGEDMLRRPASARPRGLRRPEVFFFTAFISEPRCELGHEGEMNDRSPITDGEGA